MIELKQFDTARKIRQQLTIDGAPVNLTAAQVFFDWGKEGEALDDVVRPAEIISRSEGIVEYQPTDNDVAEAGAFEFEWRVVFPGPTRLTLPTRYCSKVKIYPAKANS